MPKNISNTENNFLAYRAPSSHGNKTANNIFSSGQTPEKFQNLTEDNPLVVNISDEGRKAASQLADLKKKQLNDAQNKLTEMKSTSERMKEQYEVMNKQGEAQAAEAKIRNKCMLIAMRIMKRDEVPKEDKKYLAKHDAALYHKALLMKIQNDHPKKHKRVSEDEKTDNADQVNGSADNSSSFSPAGSDTMNASITATDTSSGSEASSDTE
jgi:hypothetical protein